MRYNLKGFFKRLSLLQKFCFSIFLIFSLAGVTLSVLIISKQRNVLRQEMNNNQLIILNNLAKDSLDALVFMDPLRLDGLVRTVAGTHGCSYAAVVDSTGRIVAHTNRRYLGRAVEDLVPSISRDRIYDVVYQETDSQNEGLREIIEPVKAGYETIGLVIAGFSKETVENVVEHNLRGLKNYIIIVTTAAMLMSIWGAFILARLLTTPIRKLKSSMELVQQGNYNAEIANDNLVNCYEIFRCTITDCPAYGKKRCWEIADTALLGRTKDNIDEKRFECRHCRVYQESCGDEIGELIEVFNQMIVRLRESLKKLEDTNREKNRLEKLSALGEMAMTVAHEIKNPLNAIRGSVSYLKDNFKGQVLTEFLTVIEEETKRLNEIVTTFMSFSRPAPLSLELSDFNRSVSETVDLIRQEAVENNVDLLANLDRQIGQLYFDRRQFKQALLNILVNALDATAPGGVVRVTSAIKEGKVVLSVSDTGGGMSEDVASNIFKPFFTTKTRGTGLGLACVERIIRDHHGDIKLRTQIGEGTEFTITMPFIKEKTD